MSQSGKFTSKKIREALRSLEPVVGRATIDALLHDLEVYNLPLVNDRAEYSLEEIKIALEKIFGETATPLFLERFKRALDAAT